MGNLLSNRISQSISAAEKTAVIDDLNKVEADLPWLTGLNVDERSSLPKINAVNRDFVADAIDVIVNNPDFFPNYFVPAEMQKDFALYNQLNEIVLVSERVHEKLRDTQMLAGSEAYIAALTAYRLLQSAAQDGVPGADALYNRLRERFALQGGKTDNSTPVNP